MTAEHASGAEPFEALRDRGALAPEVYSEARRRGLPRTEAIRVIRGLYPLSFEEAREIGWEADGYPDHMIPLIRSHDQLIAVMEKELGYCGCAYFEEAILILREALEIARDRREAFGRDDSDGAKARPEESLGAGLCVDSAPGLATWFLYFLDHRGFVEHGGNVMGCWITDKGLRLLDGIRSHYPPPAPSGERGICESE